MSVSGNARIAGVVGWPIAHSLSPALHGFWIAGHQLDAAYVPLAVEPQNFARVIAGLQSAGLRGVNVTLPHKEAAFRLADELDEAAVATGAVNTLVFGSGKVRGLNTDVPGFLSSLADAGVNELAGRSATVLGAGGAARAIVYGLLGQGVSRVVLVNRSRDKAEALAAFFGERVQVRNWDDRDQCLSGCDVLVNTTSLGMTGQAALSLDMSKLSRSAVVADIVYRPLETPLLNQARQHGLRTVDGLGMLLHQARPGFAAWFGVEPQVTVALRAHLVSLLEGRG